jgi:hypothetical protein
MEARQVKTAADALKIVRQRQLTHVKVGVHDIDGILRGKYIHVDKFRSALEGGFGFCDVVLGWDIQRPALRQRHLHWLAHGLSRRHRADPPRDLPRDRDRARQPALPL